MTNEEAKKALEEDLPRVSQFSPKLASAYKVAISALSAEGEYIKKEDALNKVEELKKIHFDRVVVLNKVSDGLNGLPTYSFPDRQEDAEYKNLLVKLENAEDVIRGLKEDLKDAREELRERW